MAANPDSLSRPYAPASASYFLNLIEDIGRALEPTPTQLDTLERSYKSTGEFLTQSSEFEGQLLEIHPQGSRELGTITRPVHNIKQMVTTLTWSQGWTGRPGIPIPGPADPQSQRTSFSLCCSAYRLTAL